MFKYKNIYTIMLSLIFFINICSTKDHTILLIQFDEHETNDAFFAGGPGNFWYDLKTACAENGYHLTTKRDNPDEVFALIAFNDPLVHDVMAYKATNRILVIWEPPTIHPTNFNAAVHAKYDTILTWHDYLVDNKKYRKFNYALQFEFPQTVIPFQNKKLCCMFVGNKQSSHPYELYSQRLQMIEFFERNALQDFDLYGPGWPLHYRTYRGYANDKRDFLKHYKFAIVYENIQKMPGYITEKIFDTFSTGCVPVYWGASNIAEHIPSNCFIAREQFASDADVYTFLKNMPAVRYNEYLKNIQTFLQSKKAELFSCKQFIKTLLSTLASCKHPKV